MHKKEFILGEAKQPLRPAFTWAATHFVRGSVYMQNVVGNILNSSYEDISRAVSLAEQAAANRAA